MTQSPNNKDKRQYMPYTTVGGALLGAYIGPEILDDMHKTTARIIAGMGGGVGGLILGKLMENQYVSKT